MNLTAMQTRCKSRFTDANQVVVDDAGWLGYLNDAYADVIAASPLWPFLRGSTSSLTFTAGVQTVALPTDVFRVSRVYDLTNQYRLRALQGNNGALRKYPQQDETGTPRDYEIFGTSLIVYPIPDAAVTLQVRYWKPPADLASGSDVPAFPSQYHRALVEGALMAAYVDDGNLDQAAAYKARYDGILVKLTRDILSTQQDRAPAIVDDWYDDGIN